MLLVIMTITGCGDVADVDLSSEWNLLCRVGGRLRGDHLWRADGLHEESVLQEAKWQSFLSNKPSNLVPFLASRIDSKRKTQVHACPWGNASEGELAVYICQHSIKKNWYELKTDSKNLRRYSRKSNRATANVIPFLLADASAREELKRCLINAAKSTEQ